MSTSKKRQMTDERSCNCSCQTQCVTQEMTITNVRLSAAYIPFQYYCSVFSPIDALLHGTAFPELAWSYGPSKKRACDRR